MQRPALLAMLLVVLLLSACGGGSNGAPPPANTGKNVNTPAPDNKPPEKPDTPPDPNAYKKLASQNPEGWVTLSKDGRAELDKHIKKLPAEFDYVMAITHKKAPGPTEPQAEWDEWTRHAAGATLYRVSTDRIAPEKAVADFAAKVAAGAPEAKTDAGVAWSPLQGGEVMLAALNNKHGTYVVVAVIMDTENLSQHQQSILKWARSLKAE
ncbi:MAG: hypothetical protein KF754_13340 [Planctomycetes bacterium]|nr:hypothetical protein [Planctomycetota bacterium]